MSFAVLVRHLVGSERLQEALDRIGAASSRMRMRPEVLMRELLRRRDGALEELTTITIWASEGGYRAWADARRAARAGNTDDPWARAPEVTTYLVHDDDTGAANS